jgi:predicted porin
MIKNIGLKIRVMISLIFIFRGISFAAHPLITDDTGVQGKNKWQLESNIEYGIEKENGEKYKTILYTNALTFGYSDNIDLILSAPYVWEKDELEWETIKTNGISDLTFEVKKRFYVNNGLSLSLKPGVRIPTGDKDKGLGSGKMGYSLYLILSKEYEKLNFHINGGYIRNENKNNERKNIYHFSIAAIYKICGKTNIVTDLGGERNTDKNSNTDPLYGIIGVIYSLNDNFDIDFGYKDGLNSSETDNTYLFGLTWRW